MHCNVLFVGLEGSENKKQAHVVPFIEVKAFPFDSFQVRHQFEDIKEYTHILFTSKNGVKYFFEALKYFQIDPACLKDKVFICIGKATEKTLKSYGVEKALVAKSETQEGLIDMLALMDLKEAYLFLPRSNKARQTLVNALKKWQVRMQVCNLYTTVSKTPNPLPDLSVYEEVVFSSPSSVDSFKKNFPELPKNLKCTAIGPITEKYLLEKFSR